MTIHEELLEIVGKLDYSWYTDIKRMYEKVYDPKTNKAKITVPGHCKGYDPGTGKECEDEIIYYDINEYCWEYDFERIRSIGDESPVEGQWVAVTIERKIVQYAKDLPKADLTGYKYDDKEIQIHDLVANLYSTVRTRITEFMESANDQEYSSVLIYILLRLRQSLYARYGHFKEKADRVKRIEALMLGGQADKLKNQIALPSTSEVIPELEKIQIPEIKDSEPPHVPKKDQSEEQESMPLPTIAEKLKTNFKKYGFYELKMIKALKEKSIDMLVVKISEVDLPYKIAMIYFLGFIDFLETQHFKTKDKMYVEIGNWFQADKREISGNIRVLNPVSGEDRKRYTANRYSQIVKEDYDKI